MCQFRTDFRHFRDRPLFIRTASAAKAAAFLKDGGIYGRTAKIAGSRIQRAQLIKAGTNKCGYPVTRPIWRFHVVVPATAGLPIDGGIDGYLEIDAQSGEEVCSPLPGFM